MENEKPVIISGLPMKTKWFYFLIGGCGSLTISIFNLWSSFPNYFEEIHGRLDLFTGICFFFISIYFFLQLTWKTLFFPSKIQWGTVFSKKEVSIKELGGHFSMDDSDLERKGVFRGIILRKKNGKVHALHKGKLKNFEEVLSYLKGKTNRFYLNSVRKILRKENLKIYIKVSIALILLSLSLLH